MSSLSQIAAISVEMVKEFEAALPDRKALISQLPESERTVAWENLLKETEGAIAQLDAAEACYQADELIGSGMVNNDGH